MTVALENRNGHLPTTRQESELMFRNSGLLHQCILLQGYWPKRNAGKQL